MPVETITDIWMRHFHYILSASAIKMHKRACFILLVPGQLFILLTGSHFADEIGSERQIINRPENILLTDARWDHHKAPGVHENENTRRMCGVWCHCGISVHEMFFQFRLNQGENENLPRLDYCCTAFYFLWSTKLTHTHTLTHSWVCVVSLFLYRTWFEGCFLLQLFEHLPLDLRFYSFDYLLISQKPAQT